MPPSKNYTEKIITITDLRYLHGDMISIVSKNELKKIKTIFVLVITCK